jgi:hypothetical protein
MHQHHRRSVTDVDELEDVVVKDHGLEYVR